MDDQEAQIRHHEIDLEGAQLNLEFDLEQLPVLEKVARRKASQLHRLATYALEIAGYEQIFGRDAGVQRQMLQLVAHAGTAICLRASGIEGSFEVPLGDGDPVRYRRTGPSPVAHAVTWQTAFHAALIARDAESLDRLGTVDLDQLRDSGTPLDDYFTVFCEALQRFPRSEDEAFYKLVEALDAADPEEVEETTFDAVLNLALPEMSLLMQLLKGDERGFDEALHSAVLHHKEYWGHGERRQYPQGFLCLGATAWASVAHDRGMAVEVRSDYLSRGLYRGVSGSS